MRQGTFLYSTHKIKIVGKTKMTDQEVEDSNIENLNDRIATQLLEVMQRFNEKLSEEGFTWEIE